MGRIVSGGGGGGAGSGPAASGPAASGTVAGGTSTARAGRARSGGARAASGRTSADLSSVPAVPRIGTGTAARRARRPGVGGPGGVRTQVTERVRAAAPAVLAVLGAGASALAVLAWSVPPTAATTRPVPLEQRVELTYQARTATGPAYPAGRLSAPDPVFLRLVKGMDVRVGYRAAAGDDVRLAGVSGTRRVTAELRSANGWHRGFEILPRRSFQGADFDAVARLDLGRIRSLADGVQRASGVRAERFSLAVRSEIAVAGVLTGSSGDQATRTPFRASFFPELTFSYDGRQLALTDADTVDVPVTRVRSTAVAVPDVAAARLGVLGGEPAVGTVRIWAPVTGLVLLLAAVLAERARRAARRDARDRVVRRIVLDDPGPAARGRARSRIPAARSGAAAERQWARPSSRL